MLDKFCEYIKVFRKKYKLAKESSLNWGLKLWIQSVDQGCHR